MSIAYSSSPIITGNTITNNTSSTNAGGGICINHDCSVTVIDNIISSNVARYGGGIECHDGSIGTIKHNIITANEFTSVSECASKMSKNRIDQMPVLDARGEIIGMIDDEKLVTAFQNKK